MKLLGQSYSLSSQPKVLVQQFLEQSDKKNIDWAAGWPGNLLSGVCE